MKKKLQSQAGLTLVELIISMVIISIILIAFIPMFVFSADTNARSKTTLDSTYLGKDAMELAYELTEQYGKTTFFDQLDEEMDQRDFTPIIDDAYTYQYLYDDGKILTISFQDEGNLVRVFVKVYQDESKGQVIAQYETLYLWDEG